MPDNLTAKGALFKNGYKKAPNHPDYRGNIEVTAAFLKELFKECKGDEPIKAQLSAWIKAAPNGGQPYMSLQLQKPWKGNEATAEPRSSGPNPSRARAPLDDDIPF